MTTPRDLAEACGEEWLLDQRVSGERLGAPEAGMIPASMRSELTPRITNPERVLAVLMTCGRVRSRRIDMSASDECVRQPADWLASAASPVALRPRITPGLPFRCQVG